MRNLKFAVVLMIGLSVIAVFGQQKPETFKLTAKQSHVWQQIDRAEEDLKRQYRDLEEKRAILLVDVPENSRSCTTGQDGIVVCVKPKAELKTP